MYRGSRSPRTRTLGIVAAAASLLGGCGLLPSAGPTVSRLLDQQAQGADAAFAVVNVDEHAVAALRAVPPARFHGRFAHGGLPAEPRIGIGDSIVVSLWEAASGGLFTSAPSDQVLAPGSHNVVLPEQAVGRDGAISVPFAGRIPAAGRLPVEVQRTIEQRLTGKAIEPQAIVSVSKSVNNSVTVTGEVVKGERVPLSLKGDRLLDVIAAAGGPRAPVHETSIRLSRGGVTATIPMEELVADPAENIYAEPGDVLTVVRDPQTFIALGAAGENNEITFPAARLTLIEAIAKAGGLQDLRSDAAGVFVFRREAPEIAASLGIKHDAAPDGRIGVVYRLDLRDANAYFAAAQFPVRDKDTLYVANATATELQKFLALVNGLTGPAVTGAIVKNATH
ncbi:MAG: polysaccharide export protein [Alphaproteobacteria bacterium]|nr:polysaccharide export protein [Alphaproteobacteria bacterium]